MAIGKDPFAHPYTRRATYGGLLSVVLVWLLGYLAINGWIPVPDDYEHVITWDRLLFASIILLILTSGLTMIVPLLLAAKQKRLEEERPYPPSRPDK